MLDMRYLFGPPPPSQQRLYEREFIKRDWIRLGAYLGFWHDAEARELIVQKAQIRRLQMYAAETHPDARCPCWVLGWIGERNQYWAHWPSCWDYEPLKKDFEQTHHARLSQLPWTLPFDQ